MAGRQVLPAPGIVRPGLRQTAARQQRVGQLHVAQGVAGMLGDRVAQRGDGVGTALVPVQGGERAAEPVVHGVVVRGAPAERFQNVGRLVQPAHQV